MSDVTVYSVFTAIKHRIDCLMSQFTLYLQQSNTELKCLMSQFTLYLQELNTELKCLMSQFTLYL